MIWLHNTTGITSNVQRDLMFSVNRVTGGGWATQPHHIDFGASSIYAGDVDLVTIVRILTEYAMRQYLLCPRCGIDCHKALMDCCTRSVWVCQTHLVRDPMNEVGLAYRECNDPGECGLYMDRRESAPLSSHAEGEGV